MAARERAAHHTRQHELYVLRDPTKMGKLKLTTQANAHSRLAVDGDNCKCYATE